MTDASSSNSEPVGIKLRQLARSFLHASAEFVYPSVCFLCEKTDEATSHGESFCTRCRGELLDVSPDQCLKCAAPVGPYVSTNNGCLHCRNIRLRFAPVMRLGVYRDAMQVAILRGKQSHAEHILAALSRLLVDEHRSAFHAGEFDVVVPVPQHWWQRLFRTNNPAEIVARAIASELDLPCCTNSLMKTRQTKTQKSLSATERRRNVRNAFSMRFKDDVAGCRVLLVDDVMTTGVTANEIAQVLKRAGAESVSLAVIARVLTTS